jgi:YbbR domain-containing protein
MKRLLNNWEIKLLALGAAVVFWFFVIGIENSVYLIPDLYPVKITNIGKNLSSAASIPSVKIYVNAKGDDVKNIKPNDYEAYVDLSGLEAGNYQQPVLVMSQNSQYPVLKVVPATVPVTLAPLGEKEVPLITEVKGVPAYGYEVQEVKSDLSTIKVSAANNILEKINAITVKVELTGTETGNIKQSVTPQIHDGLNLPPESFKTDPEQVSATAVIVPVSARKSVNVVPDLRGTYAAAFADQLVVIPSSITITGAETVLKNISEIKTEPVNVGLLLNRTVPMEVSLVMPDQVNPVDPGIKTSIMLDPAKNKQKTIFADIKIVAESPSFKIGAISPTRVKVTLSGPAGIINNLRDSDATVTINLSNMEKPGMFKIAAASIAAPEGTIVLGFEPEQISVSGS